MPHKSDIDTSTDDASANDGCSWRWRRSPWRTSWRRWSSPWRTSSQWWSGTDATSRAGSRPGTILPYHAKCNYISFPSKEPLTASMLAAAPQQDQKQMLGERMFPLVQAGIPLSLFGKMFPIFHFYFWQKISIFSGNISWPGWQSYWDAAGHWQCRDPSHAGRSQFSEGTGIRIVFNWFSDWHLFNFSGGEGCGFVPSPPGNCQGGEGGEGTKRTDKGDRRRLKQRKQTKKKKGRPSLQWMICLEIFQGGKGGVIFNQRNYLADFFLF